ncbi:PE domain-containing protein [Pseudonocardia lutea]|uniref:PE domain-containing protein n=1 Tax=Pseudonocardia lutea TaxID=2172015 RepID=A0ABW1I3S1_9PSEU
MTAPRWDDPGPVVPRSAHSLSYSPALRVDPEKVEGLVGRLEGVIDQVWTAENSLRVIGAVEAPGADPVSCNAATQAANMLEGSRAFLSSWRDQLLKAVDALRSQGESYKAADRAV